MKHEKLLSLAADYTSEGITITDPRQDDNPLVYVNKAFERITGYSKEESIGKNCRFLQGLETDKNSIKKIKKSMSDGCPVSIEILNYKKNGDKFWNMLNISPIKDESGKIIYFVGIQNECTERKSVELSVKNNLQAIENLVGIYDKLMNILSHDLRGTIGNAISFIELEKEENASKVKNMKYFDLTFNCVRESYFLLTSLLEWNVVRTSKNKELHELVICDVFIEIKRQISTMLSMKNINLKFEVNKHQKFSCNKLYLQAVLRNILTNAIKYSQEDTDIILSFKFEKKNGVFEIIDQGIGMTKELSKSLYSNKNMNKLSSTSGFGFGGVIVHDLLVELNGNIQVDSAINNGTKVIVTIPESEK
jgi:PAS domain S-box-containing protein